MSISCKILHHMSNRYFKLVLIQHNIECRIKFDFGLCSVSEISMMERRINYIWTHLIYGHNVFSDESTFCYVCMRTVSWQYSIYTFCSSSNRFDLVFVKKSQIDRQQADATICRTQRLFTFAIMYILVLYIHNNNAWHSQLRLFVLMCTIWVFLYKLVHESGAQDIHWATFMCNFK